MKQHTQPISTVDSIIFTIHNNQLKILTIKREKPPFLGKLSLPGGYIHADENQDTFIEETVSRVLKEKTGVDTPYMEQLHTFGSATRDPRGWSISVSYISLIPWHMIQENTSQHWININDIENIDFAFDHKDIIKTALKRIQSKVNYSILPVYLLPEKFTQTDLQKVYELVLGITLDKSAFRKKINALDFLEDTGEKDYNVTFRPPSLYRVKEECLPFFRSNFTN